MKTICSKCKLFDKEASKCFASKQSYLQGENHVTNGYCRLFSLQEYLFNIDDTNDILEDAKKRAEFKYTLIVLFNNKKNNYDDLHSTLLSCHDQYKFEDFIVLDIGGDPGKISQCDSLNGLLKRWNKTKFIINRTINNYEQYKELALSSIKTKIQQPYFIFIEAGQEINDLCAIKSRLDSYEDNYVYWRLSDVLLPCFGVYVTRPYQQIVSMVIDGENKTFSDKLDYIYNEKNILLKGVLDTRVAYVQSQ